MRKLEVIGGGELCIPPPDLSLPTLYMQMYDDGYKGITNVDVSHFQYLLLHGLIVSYPVLFRGHRPNAKTPQHTETRNGVSVGFEV